MPPVDASFDSAVFLVVGLSLILAITSVLLSYLFTVRMSASWEIDRKDDPPPDDQQDAASDSQNARLSDSQRKVRLGDRMGHTSWDFSKSWATNITVIGALLGTALNLEKTALVHSMFNLFFLLLAALAPFVYYLIGGQNEVIPVSSSEYQRDAEPGHETDVRSKGQSPAYQFHGYVAGFLIACVLTLWGVIGELITLYSFLGFIASQYPRQQFAIVVLFQIIVVCIIIGIIYFGIFTIPRTLRQQFGQKTARVDAAKRLKASYAFPTKTVGPELPTWAPL